MVTFASETKYNEHRIIGCITPGVKLAGMQDRRYIEQVKSLPCCKTVKGEAATTGCGEAMAADRTVVVMKGP